MLLAVSGRCVHDACSFELQAYRRQLQTQDDELRLLREENERKKSLVAMYETVLRKNIGQLPSSGDADILTLFDTAQNATRRSDANVVDEMKKAMTKQQEALKKMIVDTVDDRLAKSSVDAKPSSQAVSANVEPEMSRMAKALATHRGVALQRLTRRCVRCL